MNQLNSLIVEGKVANIIVKEVNFISFTISCERRYKLADGKDETEISYFECECFGKMAECVEKNIEAGI